MQYRPITEHVFNLGHGTKILACLEIDFRYAPPREQLFQGHAEDILNSPRIASLVIWRKLNPNDKLSGEDDRVLFNLPTAKKLVLPQLERRQAQTNLSRNLRYAINTALEDERAQTQPAEEASVSTDSTATRKRKPAYYGKHLLKTILVVLTKMANSTTVNQMDIYRTNSKQMLVTRDPIFVHPTIRQGHYIGRQPHTYFPLAVFVTILNPALGPIAIVFALMSRNSYRDGDLLYATKWSNYAFLAGMITIAASVIIYVTIFFAVAGPGLRGGHTY
ncbi:hypothetical protein ElyMa_000609900 [Elysia marginata]|uniref:Uncharacterized protein n=1 Tax=Elysia marginata TaxID=1093978 RepID=A0AAV4G994_9GAST|nr:hypothetical protein ElyMa_000609900 [Elysia marginata]